MSDTRRAGERYAVQREDAPDKWDVFLAFPVPGDGDPWLPAKVASGLSELDARLLANAAAYREAVASLERLVVALDQCRAARAALAGRGESPA